MCSQSAAHVDLVIFSTELVHIIQRIAAAANLPDEEPFGIYDSVPKVAPVFSCLKQ